MNKEMKACLKQAYEPPKPLHKEAFLRQISAQMMLSAKSERHMQTISRHTFFVQQAGYIRKSVWIISVLFFMGAWLAGRYVEKNSLWLIAAFVPFLAFVTVTEGVKSVTCHMEELEMSSRYSLRYVMMGRLVILGVCNFALLLMISLYVQASNVSGGLERCFVLFAPYLLTAALGLHMIRRVRGRESVYFCMGITGAVSVLQIVLGNVLEFMRQENGEKAALLAVLVLLMAFVRECICTMKQTEEYVWN